MKNILGLDLGSNSIGWAIVKALKNEDGKEILQSIDLAGSRIIPMDQATLGNFENGNSVSQTRERTGYRSARRLRERYLLRRERLLRVLNCMGFLPEHYSQNIDKYGKFFLDNEVKLSWKKDKMGKNEFIFLDSFNEMLEDFRHSQPQLLLDGRKVPYDWTIYYLRKKALTEKISKEELAWILLNFNQKRGYFQLRGEDEEVQGKKIEFYALKVVRVEDTGEKKGKDTWYNVYLESGLGDTDDYWVYRRASSVPIDEWEGQVKEFIVTTTLDNNGSPQIDKEGKVKRSFSIPKPEDWMLVKKKTEVDIKSSGKTVGTYIYDTLLQKPDQKIKGKLIRTIERENYTNELSLILENQKKFHLELQDRELYHQCIELLYCKNEAHKRVIGSWDFTSLFIKDILFYQRPLKSKKALIDNCPYEESFYIENGEKKSKPRKCIAKSHPLFQEFRIWQFIYNLRIYQKVKEVDGKLQFNVDVTSDFLRDESAYVELFKWLNERAEVSQEDLLKHLGLKKTKTEDTVSLYRWNYVEDKKYPGNKTRSSILKKLLNDEKEALSEDIELKIWHLLYSVLAQSEIDKALSSKNVSTKGIYSELSVYFSDETIQKIKNVKLESGYGSYSAKAIGKLLPLMRRGKYWNLESIDNHTKERIEKILNGECDETIRARTREKSISLTDISQFKGLPLWLACYIVYDRHSELKTIKKWNSPEDINKFLKEFKQHSLRNPIVEQVTMETLRVVRDIWRRVGSIDEIHIEMGRDMKQTAQERARCSAIISRNENNNLRIKALLHEFMNPELGIENVRPYSPAQQEILRIYEDGVLSSVSEIEDEIKNILKKFNESEEGKRPTKNEIIRYKCWLEQKYRSPYTGEIIPLGKLFTPAYQIEHIIPQARFFDDSFTNKVICEAEVNAKKGDLLGYEFVKEKGGEIVELSGGRNVRIFSVEEYESFVKEHYKSNKQKMQRLLAEDISTEFSHRQLNDSRYISKYIRNLLSNIVREDDEQESVSKNVISCNGAITDRLKKDWGVNDVWNHIILPRFVRLEEIRADNGEKFTTFNQEGHRIPSMPLMYQKGFNKKRIDHRHHAMDAIVIACTTRDHVNLLNNECSNPQNNANKHQLSRKLRRYENVSYKQDGKLKEREVPKEFLKPWEEFTRDVEFALKNVIVSFRQNLRVLNKTVNYFQHWKDNSSEKEWKEQKSADHWSIRKPLHKETVSGEVFLWRTRFVSLREALTNPKRIVEKDLRSKILELQRKGYDTKRIKKYFEDNKDVWQDVNLSKIEVRYYSREIVDPQTELPKNRYFATRFGNDLISLFSGVSNFEKAKKIIESITDTGIQQILFRHLENKGNDPVLAFSPEGIDEMNRTIKTLNNGKDHKPIYKVRIYECSTMKFPLGSIGNKSKKFVEAAKGTNLYFAVYEKEVENDRGECHKERTFKTIPLNDVIRNLKQGLSIAPNDENGNLPAFILSPNDLVYLPTKEESETGSISQPLNRNRIYKMVSCTGNEAHFIPAFIATPILQTIELGSNNKAQKAWTGEMIKESCIPIKVDRLGMLISINGKAV